jgi:hypothetical protein
MAGDNRKIALSKDNLYIPVWLRVSEAFSHPSGISSGFSGISVHVSIPF